MDTNIRNLLTFAKNNSEQAGLRALQHAHEYMRNVAETKPSLDGPEPFGQDLYVIGAETAFQVHGQVELTKEFLKMFFMKTQPANQFLCRAYLCQSRLLAPSSADSSELLEKAVVYLIKAINMAKEQTRYHFLVYNASVIYWQFCRPFLKPGYRQHLARSLHQVVKALDDIDDKDYEWRAQLMIALIECHMDAGRRSDASHIATAAASFIKQNVPSLYKTVFGLMVRHQLVETNKLQKDIKTSAELNVFYKISRLKLALDQNDLEKDPEEEMRKLVSILSGQDDQSSQSGVTTRTSSKDRTGRLSVSPEERKSPTRQIRGRTPTPTGPKKLPADSTDKRKRVYDPTLSKPYLLLELARCALQNNYADIAQQCSDLLLDCASQAKNSSFLLEVEFMNCDLLVKQLGDRQESYNKTVIDIRRQSIKRCDEALTNAARLGDPNTIQAGCVTLWNLCLPLLQANLRQHVRRPLSNLAEALENIQSLLIQLRCQVHMELAKCEEDQEQITVAISHLNKALCLDDGQVYRERLEVALHKLELRAELYKQPERDEDQAAMIIEQARKADSGTIRMKRSLLVRAGQALAPDAFLLVLDSENEAKEMGAVKGPLTLIKKMAGKVLQFNKCVKKAEGHLRRLGDENDRERARLWGDLAKTARKQEVWDVCRVAARFCLLYDDGRWKNDVDSGYQQKAKSVAEAPSETAEAEKSSIDLTKEKAAATKVPKDAEEAPPEKYVPLYDKDLIRMMAEINFVNGEALVHLLRSEKVELGDKPIPPEDKSKKPKGFVAKKPEEDPDWLDYCDWINGLSGEAVKHFLRAVSLGAELNETWIVCCAGAYVWNYNNHVLSQNRHAEVVEPLQTVVDGLKKVGHTGETVLLVDICSGLATGLLLPWLPSPTAKDVQIASPDTGKKSPGRDKSPKRGGKPGAAAGAAKSVKSAPTVTISPDATPDLKRAVEVCEYAIKVTNGDNALDMVPIAKRYELLLTWVKAKQMLQSNISKSLGTDDETNDSGQNGMTRAIVAVEMLSLSGNGIFEFKEGPSLSQCVELVEGCDWSDKMIELQLWTRLAYLALVSHNHVLVMHCSTRALEFSNSSKDSQAKKSNSHKFMVKQEQLSYASTICGQSLIENAQGSSSLRRQAMQHFLNSARFARNANNYELVMQAARHYWNASLPLIHLPIERELLREPLGVLLQAITDTTDKSKYKKEEEDEEDSEEAEPEVKPPPTAAVPARAASSGSDAQMETKPEATETSKQQGMIGGPEDDLTVRAYLYGVLFQSYADKGEWEAGLQAMDQAVHDMPRTNHRLLIYKHLVVVKAKLGLNVGMSVQKFKDESEDYVAHMWRRIALCSKEPTEQLLAYQNAIEALNSPSNEWQKFDYLLEFGQWLFCNDYPLEDCLDQIDWAVDILLNMKFEVEQVKKEAKGKKSKKKGKTPPSSAAKKKAGKKASTTDAPQKKSPATPGDAGKKSPAASEAPVSIMDDGAVEEEHKTPVIGVPPVNPALSITDLHDVRQLEALFRAHTLRAQLEGHASPAFKDTCLMAYAFIMQIWQVSMSKSGPVMKEIAKNVSAEDLAAKASAKNKKGGKDSKESIKEKPKRKGPLDALPSSTEDWAGYDAPDEAVEAFKNEAMRSSGVNKHTITKPTLTMLYLELLAKHLRDIGYNHLALPILAMADVVCRGLLDHRPANALMHLRAMEVCVELNLQHGATFHEGLADFNINEDDQTKSREEIALWREKQAQVLREELRLKESLVKFEDKVKKTAKSAGLKSEVEETEKTSIHLGRLIGAVELRSVWTDTAEVLLHQAAYQPARDLLNEAHMAAVEFNDKPLEAQTLYLLAKLSFLEAQYGQAVSLCHEAQSFPSFMLIYCDLQKLVDGDEMFWFNTTMLMVEATQKDYQLKEIERYKKAQAILVHSLNVFHQVAEQRPNKASITHYILAKMEASLGQLQGHITMAEHDNLLKPTAVQAVLTACKKMEHSADQLVAHGYVRQAVSLLHQQGALYVKLARDSQDTDDRHNFYVNAMVQLRRASVLSDQVMLDVHTLSTIHELRVVNTPVQREAVQAKLVLAELLCEMLRVHVRETHQKQLDDQRKGPVLRAVEELIYEAPNYTGSEKLWHDSVKTLSDGALSQLVGAHAMAAASLRQRAKALSVLGQCEHLLALLKSPDQPNQWCLEDMEVLSVAQHIEETQTVTHGSDDEDTDTTESPDITQDKHYDRNSAMIVAMKRCHEISVGYMTVATESLTQAVNLALSKGYLDVVAEASLLLVECFGQYEPGLASSYLALHQSCRASLYLEGLMKNALCDPTLSQQAALFHQRAHVMASNVTTNMEHSPTMTAIHNKLQEHAIAWKRLSVSTHHLDLLKEFPPNFNIVVLQHSPDKSYLYGAIMDKPKSAAGGGKGGAKGGGGGASTQAPSRARVVRVKTSPKQLEELETRWKWWRHEVMQLLLKREYQRSQQAQREKMLANLGDNLKQSAKDLLYCRTILSENSEVMEAQSLSVYDVLQQPLHERLNIFEEEVAEDEKRLHEEFEGHLQALEDYLAPITSQLDITLRPPSSTTVSNPEPKHKGSKEEGPPQENMILLADPHLLQLPLEALQSLQAEPIVSLTRDISLQMLHHRIHVEPLDEAAEKAKKEKEKLKPPSRIPGLRDASKKQSKIIPLDRPVPSGCVPIDTHAFRFIVDPHLDCADTEESKPIGVMNAILEEHCQQFTPRWLGVAGDEHPPSSGEYEVYLVEGGAFIFYGMERFLCYLPPHKLAALNLPECQFVMMLDLAQTSCSSLRQSKTDVLKTPEVLALEKPVETSMLLSLAGVNCVMANQWHCTLKENASRFSQAMQDFLERGKTSGQTVRYLISPDRRRREIQAQKDAEAAAANEGKGQPETGSGEKLNEDLEDESEIKEMDECTMQRGWFNMVCYGLPNLLVTQLSKA